MQYEKSTSTEGSFSIETLSTLFPHQQSTSNKASFSLKKKEKKKDSSKLEKSVSLQQQNGIEVISSLFENNKKSYFKENLVKPSMVIFTPHYRFDFKPFKAEKAWAGS